MSEMIRLTVPVELRSSLFFPETEMVLHLQEVQGWQAFRTFTTFPYDMAFFHQIEAYEPWKYVDAHISDLLEKWKAVEKICRTHFSERKAKRAMEPMKEGIALFFITLFWINSKPVHLQNWSLYVDTFDIKPVNVVERLTFIVQGSARYHAFVQLSELFCELEKHYVKSRIKNRLRQ